MGKMEGEKMAYSDKIYKKEKLISRTFYIDEKLYLELERLSKEVYEASISKLINVAIEELVEKEKIEVYSDKVTEPVYVQLGFKNYMPLNLYSTYGLPASPFRIKILPSPY